MLRSLSDLEKKVSEIYINDFPKNLFITNYALNMAFLVNTFVKKFYKRSYEWYGFLLAKKENPEIVVSIGLPYNSRNDIAFTRVEADNIAKYLEDIDDDYIINGWVHSHGNLNYRNFSHTDEENMIDVLNLVYQNTRLPIKKKEVMIRDLSVLAKEYSNKDLLNGTVTVITDNPIGNLKIFEMVYGSFSYSLVVGDSGWYESKITTELYHSFTGNVIRNNKKINVEIINDGRGITIEDIVNIKKEIRKKIKVPKINFLKKIYDPTRKYETYYYYNDFKKDNYLDDDCKKKKYPYNEKKKDDKNLDQSDNVSGSLPKYLL